MWGDTVQGKVWEVPPHTNLTFRQLLLQKWRLSVLETSPLLPFPWCKEPPYLWGEQPCHPMWVRCGAGPCVHHRDRVPAHRWHAHSSPACRSPPSREKGKPRAGAGLLSSASRLGEGCQFSKPPVGATRVPSTRAERSVPAPSLCSGRADLLICSSSLHFSDMPLGEMSARQLWDQMSPCWLDNIRLWGFFLNGSKIIPAFFKSWS